MGRIFIVDDEAKIRTLLSMAFESAGHEVFEASSGEEALAIIETLVPDVMITDIRMSGITGIDLLKKVRQGFPGVEIIVMTAYSDARSGIEAMRHGAFEYVAKPFEMDEMLLLVANALEKSRLCKEVVELRKLSENRYTLGAIVGSSKPIQETIKQALVVAKKDTTVLIRGKSGTGKELIARGIHQESGRKQFVTVNSGALPENLLESELFGHEKGSFTGAYNQKIGFFEQAGEGTIFLDEIGDISPALQVKLLRVLQEREFNRFGGTVIIQTRARIIAATNRNLEEALSQGIFREDLYYRLNVFPIFVPTLAERISDIPVLVDFFCKKYNHISRYEEGVLTCLMEYAWPGNVRELENCIERASIMANGSIITRDHIPEHIRNNRNLANPTLVTIPDGGLSLDEVEKKLILQALDKAKGNKSDAARLLGISRRAIYSKMKTHGIATGEELGGSG